jgi:hypothetical protein
MTISSTVGGARKAKLSRSNGLFCWRYWSLWRGRTFGAGCSYLRLGDRLPSMVPLIPALLASGPFGADCIPVYLAFAFTISHRVYRGSWCARAGAGRDTASRPTLLLHFD